MNALQRLLDEGHGASSWTNIAQEKVQENPRPAEMNVRWILHHLLLLVHSPAFPLEEREAETTTTGKDAMGAD